MNHDALLPPAAHKENFPTLKTPTLPSKRYDQQKRVSQQSPTTSSREYPQTPLGRVPLADLIANCDSVQREPEPSPVERVTWQSEATGTNQLLTPSTKRGKKRAQSSSPASSQKVSQPVFDVQGLQASLKTPQADPASDLWARYALPGKQTPTKQPSTAAADFLHSSSPQTPTAALRDSGGLRRAISCGNAWPITHNKRRKLGHGPGSGVEQKTVENNAGLGLDTGRVNQLLERINAELDGADSHGADVGYLRGSVEVERPTEDRRPATARELEKAVEDLPDEPVPDESPEFAATAAAAPDVKASAHQIKPCIGSKLGMPSSSGFGSDDLIEAMDALREDINTRSNPSQLKHDAENTGEEQEHIQYDRMPDKDLLFSQRDGSLGVSS